MGKKIDVASLEVIVGTLYPPPFDEPCVSRERIKLGDAAGLTQYGVESDAPATGRLVQPTTLARKAGRIHLRTIW